jgi:sugar (pentulose or hexulose) kinase
VILAIDCGSTNHKVALFDSTLNRRAVCSKPVAYTIRNGERAEFDAGKIWQDTVWQIRHVCQEAEIEPAAITSIALASQAQTFVILDAPGRPVMPFMSWMDKRAREESIELNEQLGRKFHRHCSFPSPIPELQLSKLLWVRRHHPDWLTSEAKIFSVPGFLAWRLGALHVTDTNLAAMSGLYSSLENGWWKAALEACGARREQLGELVPAGHAVQARRPCPELGLSADVRIVFAGNDQTAGAYANGVGVNQVVLTLGTALVVYRYAGQTAGPYQSESCWGPYPGGGFYELATRDEGCAALDWAVQKLMPDDARGFMERAASAAPGTAFFYPQHLHGDKAWMGSDNLAARARAVLEGLCFSARQLIESDLKLKLSEAPVTVIGGGSECCVWLQILSNVLNRPIHRGKGDALLGAAMMAQAGIKAPFASNTETVLEPVARSVAQYDALYRAWQERLPTTRNVI